MIKRGGLAAACLLLLLDLVAVPASAADQPAMIVVIAVDQLRRDRLDDGFAGGLGRMLRQGRVFDRATLDHAITSTCPGHAAILTGVNPGKAGIPGNEYIDRTGWETLYCFEGGDDTAGVIGGTERRSPRNLRVTTLGDWLQNRYPEGKVFSVGGKDRAVIAMGGHHVDGAYWFDAEQGRFTSSLYYTDALPAYIQAFNGDDPLVDGFLAKLPATWEHGPGPFREDDYPGENDKYENHSGHPLNKGDLATVAAQVWSSPYQDTAVVSLARRIVEEENLGRDGSPDLLAIGLSATDTVGHMYGPFSGESAATLDNLDEELGSFLAFLDDRFGAGRVTVVLTADHGVAPLPEWTAARGENRCPVDAGRVDIYGFVVRLYWYVYSQFTFPLGLPTSLVKFAGQQVSINRDYAEQRGLDPNDVIEALEQRLEGEPAVKEVWNRAEILAGESEMARLYRNSLVGDKSGDLVLQVHPDCIIRDDHGTNHGTPYEYDRAVPLVFYGWGVEPGRLAVEAHSIDIAPSLAQVISLEIPVTVDGRRLPLSDREIVEVPDGVAGR